MAYDFFKATEKEFNKVYGIMEESFPENELRSRVKMYELLTTKENYSIYCVGSVGRQEKSVIGFIVMWELDDIVFFEKLAVEKHMRGKGLRGLLFDLVVKDIKKPIVMEVEAPNDFKTKRRVNLYQKHKMVYNDYSYLLPPLKQGDNFLPLKLMSYPKPLSHIEFEDITDLIHKEVYNYHDGDNLEIIY